LTNALQRTKMKFIKYIIIFFLVIGIQQSVKATGGTTISGYGCSLGNQVYVNKIGTSNFWGTQYDVYNSNGTSYPIDWNNTSQCNSINTNSVVSQNKACWVNSYVNPTNNNSGVSNGTLVYYTTRSCVPLPLDDYIWLFIILIGTVGAYFIYKKQLIPSQL
jgi:hypothetical protein